MSDMSEMSVKEAYKVMQANCGIEKGDTVEVLRVPTEYDRAYGWTGAGGSNYFCNGKRVLVEHNLGSDGFSLKGFVYSYPFPCLRLIEKAKPELPPIMVGNHEVEFLDGEIEVGCETVSKETLLQILERLEN